MDFPQYDFDNLNETDIREEIIAPLLRHLGYRSGTENNVIREQQLAYPKSSLGRKKKNDPILRGKADYICTVQGQINWVIEAKAPDADLDNDAVEQSWTYANHPEIRAVYFCLSNGVDFKIFQTNRGPETVPIFQCNYENMEKSLSTIRNILSPEAILRDHPEYELDTGVPIGPGLRSIVRITNGSITFRSNTLNFQPLTGLTMTITDGSLERNENGQLETYIETEVPFQSLQKLNEKLGLHSMRMLSETDSLSAIPDNPTTFVSTTNHILPQGEMVLDLTTWKKTQIPINLTVKAQTSAVGFLENNTFHGEFKAILTYHEIRLTLEMEGFFRVHLS